MHICLDDSESGLLKHGLKYIWNRIHPKDLLCLHEALDELLYFIKFRLPKEKENQLSFSWNYRFRKHDGTYINLLQNTTPFSFGLNKARKGLSYFTVLNQDIKMSIRASVGVLNKMHDYKTIFMSNCSRKSFLKKISQREKDIIKLLAQKKSSKVIGKALFISSNTVDTHRRNILKKLKLSSTGELVGLFTSQEYLI